MRHHTSVTYLIKAWYFLGHRKHVNSLYLLYLIESRQWDYNPTNCVSSLLWNIASFIEKYVWWVQIGFRTIRQNYVNVLGFSQATNLERFSHLPSPDPVSGTKVMTSWGKPAHSLISTMFSNGHISNLICPQLHTEQQQPGISYKTSFVKSSRGQVVEIRNSKAKISYFLGFPYYDLMLLLLKWTECIV